MCNYPKTRKLYQVGNSGCGVMGVGVAIAIHREGFTGWEKYRLALTIAAELGIKTKRDIYRSLIKRVVVRDGAVVDVELLV